MAPSIGNLFAIFLTLAVLPFAVGFEIAAALAAAENCHLLRRHQPAADAALDRAGTGILLKAWCGCRCRIHSHGSHSSRRGQLGRDSTCLCRAGIDSRRGEQRH